MVAQGLALHKRYEGGNDMRKRILALTLAVALLTGLAVGLVLSFGGSPTAAAKGADPTLVVALRGTDNGFLMDIPETPGGATQGLCYDLAMVDVKTGKVIGNALDCLADIGAGEKSGVILTGTTFFNFPGGQLVSRGRTTVQELNEPATIFTHITGAIPAPGSNQVLSGTRRFKKASGTVRLSGTVDLTNFTGQDGDPITFDCIFEINLKDM